MSDLHTVWRTAPSTRGIIRHKAWHSPTAPLHEKQLIGLNSCCFLMDELIHHWVESIFCQPNCHFLHVSFLYLDDITCLDMDVSKNRGIPKWMVYNGKPNYLGVALFLETPIYTHGAPSRTSYTLNPTSSSGWSAWEQGDSWRWRLMLQPSKQHMS